MNHRKSQRGAGMIEVLVTMVIIAFGLLGMAGLQSRMQVAEMEAYQRAQALVLLNDMANRLSINRNAAIGTSAYVTANEITSSTNCTSTYAGTATAALDLRDWCLALQGASETRISGGVTTNLGAMVNARGCVTDVGNRQFMIAVAWQGLVPISAPPVTVPCGLNQFNGDAATTGCVRDLCRRVVTTIVRIAPLT